MGEGVNLKFSAETNSSPNRTKANFDSVYDRPDPREYFRQLAGLDYIIPDLAKEIFRRLVRERENELGRSVRVLDIGCSYGINAALIRHPIDIQRLVDRYGNPAMRGLETMEVAALDAHYFQSWPRQTSAEFVGLDRSASAVSYALSVGLLDEGLSSNFEAELPTDEEAELLARTDVIISTGAVGYVTERTFRAILRCMRVGTAPLVASFVLRMFPYEAVAAELSDFGLVTEKLEGVTFVQRRFESIDEFEFDERPSKEAWGRYQRQGGGRSVARGTLRLAASRGGAQDTSRRSHFSHERGQQKVRPTISGGAAVEGEFSPISCRAARPKPLR